MLEQVDVGIVEVFDELLAEMVGGFLDGLNVLVAQAGQDKGVVAGNVLKESLAGFKDFFIGGSLGMDVPKDVEADEGKCLLDEVVMFHVKVLQYFEGNRALFRTAHGFGKDVLEC